MANLEWIWLLLFSLSQLVQSDEYPVDNWQTPNEHMADFKETYSVGDTIIIEWAGWDSFYTENLMQNKTKANLYVNSWSDEETTEPVILACKKPQTNLSGQEFLEFELIEVSKSRYHHLEARNS